MKPITVEILVFFAIILTAIGAFARALWGWHRKKESVELPGWRNIAFQLGFIAVAGQLVLFAIPWTHIGRSYALFAAWARLVYPSFLVAVIFVAAGKGSARRWLLLSSILLFVLCFFTMLSA
jgi:hypothetical protein